MSQQGTNLNNEKDSGGIGTISSGQVSIPGNTDVGVVTTQPTIPTTGTVENGQQGEGDQTEQNEEEKPGLCDDPCHKFHFVACALFPPYMFVWMSICLKQEGEEEYNEEEDKRIREQEREEYFAERKREKEEKARKKEEKKQKKEEKKRAKKEAKEANST